MPWTLSFVLTVFPPLAAINYYIGRKVLRALVDLTTWNRTRLRVIVVGILSYVNLLPVVYLVAYLFGGRSVVPAFGGDNRLIDLFLSYPFWMALVVSIQIFIVYAILDILEFSVLRLVPAILLWWSSHKALLVVGLLFFVGVYSIATIIRDTWSVRLIDRAVELPEGFSSLRGFRIAQISDVQGDGRTTYDALRRYVDKVNAVHPDVVLFAGDLVTAGTHYIDSTAEILGNLRSRYGTIAAIGDHDIFTDKEMVVDALLRSGINVVEDSTIYLSVDSSKLALSVVTYTYPERPTAHQLDKLSGATPGAYRALLVHQPADHLVDFAQKRGYRLLLAGHTHGGGLAFGIPGLFLVAPASFETKYLSGLYRVGNMAVSVTNGLGFTLAPIRFHAPAEIVLITLR